MTGGMEDLFDAPPPPSIARPAFYGAACGVALTLIFFLSYLLAPGLPLGGTALIAAGVLLVLALILNYVPSRAGEDLAAMSMGEAPAPLTGETVPTSVAGLPSADDIALGELDARVTNRRTELEQVSRSEKPVEWVAKLREMADALKELATREMTLPQRRRQKAGLGHMRQAQNAYRKVVDARGKNRSEGQWALAQIALAECQLVLGEAEGARDQVMLAVNGFSAALEVSELLPAERRAGENGLAQAEGVLAGMAEMDRPDPGDDSF